MCKDELSYKGGTETPIKAGVHNAGISTSDNEIGSKVLVPEIVKRNTPDTMLSKLQQVNLQPMNLSGEKKSPPLCLLHFSDIHGDAERLANVLDFAAYYKTYIRDIIHTGDSVFLSSEDGIEYWQRVPGSETILNAIGNHDIYSNGMSGTLSMDECYDLYFDPYIENWNAVYEKGKTFYYKDYPENCVRLIVLDVIHQTEDQLEWFEETLGSAKKRDYHVLAAVHARPHWLFQPYTESAWDDKAVISWYDADRRDRSSCDIPENLSDHYAAAVDKFISAGGYFIAWIHGHMHFKMLAKLSEHPKQLDIGIGNAAGAAYSWTFISARINGTRSEDNFNILSIDTGMKMIRLLKVGVDYDYCARHIETCCYDYANHRLISG